MPGFILRKIRKTLRTRIALNCYLDVPIKIIAALIKMYIYGILGAFLT